MNYFTPELYALLQDFDPSAMTRADADWEAAEQRYEQHLQRLQPALAPVLERFAGLLLHDALVLGMNRRGDQLVLILHKDIPPRDVVTLTYTLVGEPFIDPNAFPAQFRSGKMQYEYDEFDLREGSQPHFLHSILFSNGWEVRLPFRDVEITLAQPVYPVPAGTVPTASAGAGLGVTAPAASR